MGEYDDMFYDPPSPRKQVRLEAEIERLRKALKAERSRCAAIARAMGCDEVADAILNPDQTG